MTLPLWDCLYLLIFHPNSQEVNMKSNFDQFNEDWPLNDDLNPIDEDFEKFLLLSAYLDGEVTPQERKQVQQWLDTDPQFKQQYLEQLRLHQGVNRVPIPSPSDSSMVESVFHKIDQQDKQRRLLIGSGILVAAILSAFTSNFWLRPSFTPKFSTIENLPQEMNVDEDSESLVIALNQPIVEIPEDIQSDI